MLKRNFRILIAACLALLFIAGAAGCGIKGGEPVGGRLENNVARIYEHDARKSHFVLNTTAIEGEVTGMAFMDAAADGKTSLAWVGANLYFVSEKGVDSLANGIETAEISFDGRVAVWLDAGQVKKYCVDDRSVTVLVEGVEKLVQAAISPHSEIMMLDVIYEGDEEQTNVTLKCTAEGVEEFSRSMICFAVSDDGGIMYYYDGETKGFTVKNGEDVHLISKELKGTSSYNFTRSLKEVTYDDNKDVNHLFCLDTMTDTEIGSGFGYTGKTDVYSMSIITYFAYINDVDSFRNGFWTARRITDDEYYLYDLGYIDDDGSIRWLASDSAKVITAPDQSRAVWRASDGKLMSIESKAGAEAKVIADSAKNFDVMDNCTRVWYTDLVGTLYTVKNNGKAKEIKGSVSSFACIGGGCSIITVDGRLYFSDGGKPEELNILGCVRFDKRAGMLILYANASKAEDDTEVYDAYLSADGKSFSLAYQGVEP